MSARTLGWTALPFKRVACRRFATLSKNLHHAYREMQAFRCLQFSRDGTSIRAWRGHLNERGKCSLVANQPSQSPNLGSRSGIVAPVYCVSGVCQQRQQQLRHVKQAAYRDGRQQSGSYDRKSNRDEQGENGWGDKSQAFRKGVDRRSGDAGVSAVRRHLQEGGATRQHSEREDYAAPSWEPASTSELGPSYSSDSTQKWQLFPIQQPGQRPVVERQRREPRLSQTSPTCDPRDPVMFSREHDSIEPVQDDNEIRQRRDQEARRQRSKQGVAAFVRSSAPQPASPPGAETTTPNISTTPADDQFFEPGSSFGALGLHPSVVAALQRVGLSQPSHVQAQAVPVVMAGSDTVIAAETGCGKTLAYLAPLISQLLERREQFPCNPNDTTASRWRELAIVLLPNAALCKQALAVADSLKDAEGVPLVATTHLSSSSPPRPHQQLDIAVVTSGALQQLLHGGWMGGQWSREGLPKRLRWLVVDEADLLLSGGFAAATEQLLEMLRLDERSVRRRQAAWQLGLPALCWDTMPHHLRQAASKGGAAAALAEGHHSVAGDTRPLLPAHPGVAAPGDGDDAADDCRHRTDWKRQYALVGATIPGEGRKSVAEGVRAKFPQAVWLSGGGLHRPQSTVRFDWRLVDDTTWLASLQEAVIGGHLGASAPGVAGCRRTLVFARDVAAAKEVAQCLESGGAAVLTYHKGVKAADRDAALETLASDAGVVVVATDSAARGLDIPGVMHVVQADFAASAVDFLHRVGRTGRAGRPGKVTSLYTQQSEPLALALRDAIEGGEAVEGAFSRNRSFGKKFKKYGKYVPRGQEGPRREQ